MKVIFHHILNRLHEKLLVIKLFHQHAIHDNFAKIILHTGNYEMSVTEIHIEEIVDAWLWKSCLLANLYLFYRPVLKFYIVIIRNSR